MIFFKEIFCRNFLSTGNDGITFNYDTGLFYCYGINRDASGESENTLSNGAGKTVILVDAPLFALFGKTQRNINKADIINNQNDSECVVRLTLSKDEDEYIIERSLKPDKITIYKNGEAEKEEAKKKEANRVIEEEILDGISFDVFKNLIVLNGNSSKHFFEYNKAEKRSFINEVFRLGFLDYLQATLTEDVKEYKSKLEVIEVQKDMKEKEIERFRGLIEASASGDVVDMSLSQLQTLLTEQVTNTNALSMDISYIENHVFNGDPTNFNSLIESKTLEYTDLCSNTTKISMDINTRNFMIQELREQYKKIKDNNCCISCTQSVPALLKNHLLSTIAEAGATNKTIVDQLTETKTVMENESNEIRSWLDFARKTIEDYDSKVYSFNHSKLLIEQYDSRIKEKENNPKSVEKIVEEMSNLERELNDNNRLYEDIKNEFLKYKICKDIVSDKNFYGYYIGLFRQYLNKTINEYLEQLASPHRIEFNGELEAEVTNGNLKINSYQNLSTGERAKVNLGLLLSFFDVLNHFHRLQTNILILDESLDVGLDDASVLLLLNILKRKVDENELLGIYVVSHKSFESTFSAQVGANKVVFEKINGFTRLMTNE